MEPWYRDPRVWAGVFVGAFLAVPLSVVGNLITPRVANYLSYRKDSRTTKTKERELAVYRRITRFREKKADPYVYYLLLSSFSIILMMISISCCVVVMQPGVLGTDNTPSIFSIVVLGIAAIAAILAFGLLMTIQYTSINLYKFNDYENKVRDKWGLPGPE